MALGIYVVFLPELECVCRVIHYVSKTSGAIYHEEVALQSFEAQLRRRHLTASPWSVCKGV